MKRFKMTDPRVSRNATLAAVARVAGVSLGTASNTFNRPELVRPDVRASVQAAADLLGYAGPDPIGRMLMGGRANVIAVIPPGDMSVAAAFQSPFFREFTLGIAQVCDDNGCSLVVLPGSTDRKAWAITNAVVDGFILGHRDEVAIVEARRRRVPCVVVDMDAAPGIATVGIAAREGARLAAKHLIDLGHRRFIILSIARSPKEPVIHRLSDVPPLSMGNPIDEQKLQGYREALVAEGVSLEDSTVVEVYPHPPWRDEGAKVVLDVASNVTGILAMADRNASAILQEASSRGIRVPDDLSVVGFDDAPEAMITFPPLTTVAQPLVEKGRRAAALLFNGAPPEHIVLPVELVLRSSTSRARFASAM